MFVYDRHPVIYQDTQCTSTSVPYQIPEIPRTLLTAAVSGLTTFCTLHAEFSLVSGLGGVGHGSSCTMMRGK